MNLDEDVVERRPLGMIDLEASPFQRTSLFSASPKCFFEWKLLLPTFQWKEWPCDWWGMMEVCWRVGGNSWREMGVWGMEHFSLPLCGKGYYYHLSCEQDGWITRVEVYHFREVWVDLIQGTLSVAWVKGRTSVNRLAVCCKSASGGSITAEERCGRRVSPRMSCVITCFFNCSLR